MFRATYNIENFFPVFQAEQHGGNESQVRVLEGQNFAWHTNGVFSAYAHELCATAPGTDGTTRHPGSFNIARNQYSFFNSGVYTKVAGVQVPVFPCPRDDINIDREKYKWTYAYVGTAHYFSHPEWSEILYYDQHDDTWGKFRPACWNGPIYGITHAENRLIVMLTDTVGWSSFDQGQLGWDCASPCGSGYQSLALIRYGCPLTVMPYQTGWLSFTDKGVMISMPTTDLVPDPEGDGVLAGPVMYRHEELTFDNLAIGPTAVEHINEKDVIWLCDRGYWHMDGLNAVPWQPEWSAWWRDYLRDYTTDFSSDSVMLSYIRPFGHLVTSHKAAQGDQWYEHGAVYQFDLEKWGSFDKPHKGFSWDKDEMVKSRYKQFFSFFDNACAVQDITHGPTDDSYIKLGPLRLDAQNELHEANDISLLFGVRLGFSKRPWVDNVERYSIRGTEDFWNRMKRENQVPTHCDVYTAGSEDGVDPTIEATEPATLVTRSAYAAEYSCHTSGHLHLIVVETQEEIDFFDVRHLQLSFLPIGV